MSTKKEKVTFLRLSEEEKRLLLAIANHYGITQADAIRIALKEYAKNHGIEVNN